MCAPSGPFYRVAGMSYLRYSNICADLLRNVLKEPFKAKAQARQAIHFRQAPYVDGKAGASKVYELENGIPKTAN
uniref:epsilon: Polytomella F-ATP synthase epsilon subunit n=1 Tax=Polytomella sp. Pringsheim 198.80 TaxID=37502 RepID=A0A5H1ZR74_9CHLO|nr:Chain Q, epsilon: Polytomella F-ATP synthase epsilon subunit [Polytomella sp. Pringsheim 198.80]6RD9_Q Chain Q, epsilon: Polytomella F-ATP synthase epsilon subunit [Polytomella sp. Pringsheim 198.80]6RDB_Q Chain Q, epsilon: Polytomella F-ATP synthase epsilon subunit [Polytomella sp. Pringsheim 198.80]6RDC_Q Chain Q, epsilon: Polytomella F-ATP synthase epsilon subunit [Polytomella sp. Pringsheim 198.80]6RDE_Q Chain Q, epsilon: Polytomella F-ATP synthase epsilon subunit [Polytomella sp. Prings|eukprot:CAMPEP_0175055780 /NCGR_PEP_ID=MMETSP0052_2-20121109/10282_1 /TAXON_ID=51329 ORGANISM="Polytomella parva, Strain SAG 63-3" /NCGR_SAMPLE_ID=MMETSP0052_2 /ASSEMBLY_ACC=CAM_ASM_000194 /LENGTH=74 /DNA_ID=CAMNT_0016320687 /DNA_START=51 /DNA_END=275 /DNA_ORIENTATION=+